MTETIVSIYWERALLPGAVLISMLHIHFFLTMRDIFFIPLLQRSRNRLMNAHRYIASKSSQGLDLGLSDPKALLLTALLYYLIICDMIAQTQPAQSILGDGVA